MTEPTDNRPLDEVDEQQLEQYLKGDSSVSRRYRQLPGAEVPASLDRLILSQAQEAVKHRSSRPAWVRWSAPFAVAASAVLALAIVIETGVRDETAVSTVLRSQQPAMETGAAEESAPKREPRASLEREAPSAVEMRMPEPTAAPAPRPAAPAFAPPPPEARAKRYVANEAREYATVEQVTKAAQGEAEASADAAAEDERIATERMLREEQSLSAASRGVVDTRAPVAVYSPISANIPAPPRTYLDPEEWLKDIRQLRKQNKQEQANQEWRRFRAAFPNHEVAETDSAREPER